MDPLGTMVECVMNRLSPTSTRAVRALVAARGSLGRADTFARSMGLRNRDQLRRVLDADGLPCLEDLAAWIRVLGWVVDAETQGVTLSCHALRSGKDPGSCYRTAKRLTGKTWGEIRMLGADWVLIQFARVVAPPDPAKHGLVASDGQIQPVPAVDRQISA